MDSTDWESEDLLLFPALLRSLRQVISSPFPLLPFVRLVCLDCKLFRTETVSDYIFVQHLAQWGPILVGTSRCYWNANNRNHHFNQTELICRQSGRTEYCAAVNGHSLLLPVVCALPFLQAVLA